MLERAEAEKSDNVLILSDDKSSAGANRTGILSALAIRQVNNDVSDLSGNGVEGWRAIVFVYTC